MAAFNAFPETIDKFKSNVLKKSGARPYLFRIYFYSTPVGQIVNGDQYLLVKGGDIPGRTINQTPINYGGRVMKLPANSVFDDWTVTIINDQNFTIRNKICEWMRFMVGGFDGTKSKSLGSVDIKKNEASAIIEQWDMTGSAVQSYQFHNMWPNAIADTAVDWGTETYQEFGVTFSYDYWTHGTKRSTKDVVSTGAPSGIAEATVG